MSKTLFSNGSKTTTGVDKIIGLYGPGQGVQSPAKLSSPSGKSIAGQSPQVRPSA